jgi:hypothetical protein
MWRLSFQGVSMRKFSKVMLAVPAVVLASIWLPAAATAESPINTACKAYATAVADDYMSDEMVRLEGSEDVSAGNLIVHAYGRKFVLANHVAGEGPVVRRSIGTITREWGQVYSEERRRCLRDRRLGEFLADN